MPDDARPAGGSPAPAEHELLTRLGKYVIERKLGSGGMGTVFLAKDSDLKRTVALKVLAKDRAENPVLVRRFKAEGQAAAYLQHKNIVGVYDSGQIDGFLYIALEFVEGQDVLEIIRKRGVIPVKRSIEIIKQVAEALDHAYEKQIVHRDIKPSNLLIKNDGTVKLADLGLARSIDETLDTSITRVGTTVGTVDYMSPEQARNSKATDIRSDLYSLGCTWYHMLTGVPPYGEGSVTNKLQAHATAPLPDPRSRNERIPEGVVAVLHRMMAKQAKDRYQTPAELLEDLNNPGIARSGLNADVLAALAQPENRAAQESSSGDIFESRAPFDSVELNSAVDTLRQDALQTGVVFDDDSRTVENDESDPRAESSTPTRPRNKPAPEKETPRGKAPPREERVEEPDRPIPTRRTPPRSKGGDPGKSGPLPRRQSETEREASANVSDSAKHRFKQRKLPPRANEAALESEPVRMSLDPDRIRTVILGGVVLAVLVGIGFAFSRMGGDGTGPGAGTGNAAAAGLPQQDPVQPTPVAPDGPTEPPGDSNAQAAPVVPGEPNDASTPLRKAAAPIAGAEEFADLNSKAARDFIPSWVFQVRKEPVASAKTTVVRRPGTPGEGVPTFAEALAKLPSGPAIIEFHGEGPFRIASGALSARPQLVLRAANGSRPVLVFNPADLKAGQACLRSEGPVVMQGLHLVLATTTETPAGVAIVEGPSISMKECTLQSVGPATAGTALVRVTGGSNAAGAILENCHLRSKEGNAVALSDADSHVLAGNSLFCLEKGSAFAVAAASGTSTQGREVTLLRSSVISGGTGVSLAHEGAEAPAPINFALRKTAWMAGSPSATLLKFNGWPASEETLTDKPTAVGISWKSEQTSLEGWNTYAQMTGMSANGGQFADDGGWQKFWRQSPAGTRLDAKAPEVPTGLAEQDASALAAFGSTRDLDPGCRISAIPSAPMELVDRVRILASARRLPSDFIAYRKPSAVVDFELKPGTLNALLNDTSKCPDGALVQLRGAGIKVIPAVEIQNRTLQIVFVQTEGAPLTLRPQPGSSASALFTVKGGSVSILNGRFQLPESDRQTFPPSLFDLAGANFSLTNCTLTGPAEESTRLGPLIRWTAGEGSQGLLIKDSFLAGGRSALEAEATGRRVEIDNSILASFGDAISLSLADAARPAAMTITSSTLGAGRSIVNVAALPSGGGPSLTAIMSDSVVLATQAGNKAAMLAVPAREDVSRIAWWEDGVGYAPDAAAAVRTQSGNLEPGAWGEAWGPGHVLRVCASELAVLFEKPLENLAKTDLATFRLNSRSLAASWSSSGGALGASGSGIGASTEAPPSSPPAGSANQKPVPVQPKRPASVF